MGLFKFAIGSTFALMALTNVGCGTGDESHSSEPSSLSASSEKPNVERAKEILQGKHTGVSYNSKDDTEEKCSAVVKDGRIAIYIGDKKVNSIWLSKEEKKEFYRYLYKAPFAPGYYLKVTIPQVATDREVTAGFDDDLNLEYVSITRWQNLIGRSMIGGDACHFKP